VLIRNSNKSAAAKQVVYAMRFAAASFIIHLYSSKQKIQLKK